MKYQEQQINNSGSKNDRHDRLPDNYYKTATRIIMFLGKTWL